MNNRIYTHSYGLRYNNRTPLYLKDKLYYLKLSHKDCSIIEKVILSKMIYVEINSFHKKIPCLPGVYVFFIKKDNVEDVLYIGSSKSLYNRLTSHSLLKFFRKNLHTDFSLSLAYVLTENSKEIETQLIQLLKPLLNIQKNWTFVIDEKEKNQILGTRF